MFAVRRSYWIPAFAGMTGWDPHPGPLPRPLSRMRERGGDKSQSLRDGGMRFFIAA